MKNLTIGFIGQGYIGKNYADDFVNRGYSVVRYALEEPYVQNKEKIAGCDIVFIAVPTPSTPEGFDDSIVRKAARLVGEGKIAVIKSTVIPGTTESIQHELLNVIVLNSPEFLSEATAARDAANPSQNIIGISLNTEEHHKAAELVLSVLPKAREEIICKSVEAELFKYIHNVNGYIQIVMFNLIHNLALELGGDWDVLKKAIEGDPFMRAIYANPIHKTGRGAGGHCFIKDFAAFIDLYERRSSDDVGVRALRGFEEKNIELLKDSKKDLALLSGVYGKNILN